jgi:uncharacterized protein YdhG (YjbR/CyaY superfamily)
MAKTDFKTVDEYIATFPEETQKVLKEMRAVIRAAVPEAEEVISYQIPAYKAHGGFVIYFSGYTKHCAVAFPPPFTVYEQLAKELAPYKVSKSSVAFPFDMGVPIKLVGKIATMRNAQLKAAAGKSATVKSAAAKPKPASKAKAKKA